MTALLQLDGVHKQFGHGDRTVVACDRVSFEVRPGEVVGLVGESGSGKSTVANLVLGLIRPDAGRIVFDGRPLDNWLSGSGREYRASVQAVFQQPLLALDSRRTIEWCVGEPLVIHGRGDRSARRQRIHELLASVGLDPVLASRKPRELSGGQLQRVNIARALALEPRLLVCDEPVSALDVSVQAQVLNLFLDIQQRLGTAMLFIGHDLAVVRHLSDRIVVMRGGEVVEQGETEQLCRHPSQPYTHRLLEAVPEIPQEGVAGSLRYEESSPS